MKMDYPFIREIQINRSLITDPDRFPFSIPSIKYLDSMSFSKPVTFFVGENGSGKSTLLESIAIQLGINAEGGSRNFKFSTRPANSELSHCLKIIRNTKTPKDYFFLRAESYFNLSTNIEHLDEQDGGGPRIIDSYGGVSLHEQSHGESFFALFENRLRSAGIYLMDEPEAALSPSRQLAALSLIHQMVENGCQLIIATHSPILMAYPNAEIYGFSNQGIKQVNYEETEHYQVTVDFLNRKDKMLEVLMGSVEVGGSDDFFS